MIIDKMEKDELTYHVPVLLKESVDGMNIQPDGTYVDVTFGGSSARDPFTAPEKADVCWDSTKTRDAERNIVNDTHFIFVRSNFRYLHNFLRYHNIEQVDAIRPTSAYLPIISMIANVASPSVLTGHWICV